MSINDLLTSYAVESGEIADPSAAVEIVPANSDDVAIAVVANAGEPKLPDEVEHAEKAQDIAEQLDELAERAEELAGEDKAYLDSVASTESLHREYACIMRAYGLALPAESFESAHTDKGRLEGLAKDARRGSRVARGYRDAAMDFSSEGKIMQFLRRDAAKLEDAGKALENAERIIHGVAPELRETPVAIKHDGMATFMSQGGKPVENLASALHDEEQWLSKAHKYAEDVQKALMDALQKLGHGDPSAALHAVKGRSLPAGHAIATGDDDLMGSYSVTAGGEGNGFFVPKFSRGGRTNPNWGKALGTAIGKGLLNYVGWCILGGVVTGVVGTVILGPGGATALFAGPTGHALRQGIQVRAAVAGVQAGVEQGHAKLEETKAKSSAGYTDILKSIQIVRGYGKYTNIHIDDDSFAKALTLAKGNIGHLQGEEKKEAAALISQIETGFARIVRLIDAMYEQAFYTTTMSAGLLERVAKAAKKKHA